MPSTDAIAMPADKDYVQELMGKKVILLLSKRETRKKIKCRIEVCLDRKKNWIEFVRTEKNRMQHEMELTKWKWWKNKWYQNRIESDKI